MDDSSSLQTEVSIAVKFTGVWFFGFLCGFLVATMAVLCLFDAYTKTLAKSSFRKEKKFKPVVLSPLHQNNIASLTQNSSEHLQETCVFINAILVFMFKEWRDTAEIQRWMLKKVNVELIELMETKTAMRLLQAIKIHELQLGSNVPVIHGVKIVEPLILTNNQVPQSVILDVDIEYEGGFLLAVDVDLVFGKSAFISVGIKYLKGCVRVQFGRIPCTHWSVSFKQDPVLKFIVDTSFESRQLPQLGTLLTNQIQRMIRRKHTFPYYKLRYNPFFSFQHSSQPLFEQNIDELSSDIIILDVTVVRFSRLAIPKNSSATGTPIVFATLSLDAINCETLPAIKRVSEVKNKLHVNGNLDENILDLKGSSKQETELKTTLDERISEQFKNKMKYTEDSLPSKTKNIQATSTQSHDASTKNQSYVMVTKSFSATLHEVSVHRAQSVDSTTVNVVSLSGNLSPTNCGIRVGDRILEINGQRILSLSQAIAIIENVRRRREKIQFKVHRNRSSTDKSKPKVVLPNTREDSEADTESDYSEIDSDEYTDILSMDKIKQIQDELEGKINTYNTVNTESTINLHGHSKEPVAKSENDLPKDQTQSSSDGLNFAKLFQDSTSKIFKTSCCIATDNEGSWNNEKFSFDVGKEHKYLNIRFWYNEKNKQDMLIGNLGIPLCELEVYCNMTTSNKFTRKYKIASPVDQDFKLNIDESFVKRSAYRKQYCFGDGTVCVKIKKDQNKGVC